MPGARLTLILSVGGLILGSLVLYVGLMMLSMPERVTLPGVLDDLDPQVITVIIMVGFFLALFGLTANIDMRKRHTAYLVAQLVGAADKAVDEITGPDDLMGLIRANRKQMEAYDALARSQASSTHAATLGAAVFGLLAVGAGLTVAVTADATAAKYAAAIVAGVGTATGGYVASTFIRVQEGAREQMRYYYAQPLVQSYLLSAERLVSTLKDRSEQSEQTMMIIAAALAQTTEQDRLVLSPSMPGPRAASGSSKRRWPWSKRPSD